MAAVGSVAGRNANQAPRMTPILQWPVALLPIYIGLQLVPLPLRFVEFVSPARAGIHQALATVVPIGGFAPISVIPATTLLHFVQAVNCAVVFLSVRRIVWRLGDRPWIAALPLVMIGILEAIAGLVQSYTVTPGKLPSGTYINHNHFAGLLEMVLPFAVLYPVPLLSRPESRNSSLGTVVGACFFMGAAGLILAAILLCLSRMGLIASLIGLCVCGGGMVLCSGWLRKVSRARRGGVLAVGGMIFVILGLIFLPPDQLVARFATSDVRTEIWTESLPLVRSYWLLGCGSGGYESVFMKYKHTDPMYRVDYAHNDFLQRLVELGIVGTLIGGSLILGVLLHARRAARKHPVLSGRALAVACISAITAILVHSLVDFNLYIPANAMVLAWICGIAVSVTLSSHPVRPVHFYGGGVRIVDVQP
jgi:O-antigen ligase